MQRELVRLLQVERATLSAIVGSLVRKGLIEQVADRVDQRQKLLRLTPAGTKLWGELPDLKSIRLVAFKGIKRADLAVTIDVLRTATERLDEMVRKGSGP